MKALCTCQRHFPIMRHSLTSYMMYYHGKQTLLEARDRCSTARIVNTNKVHVIIIGTSWSDIHTEINLGVISNILQILICSYFLQSCTSCYCMLMPLAHPHALQLHNDVQIFNRSSLRNNRSIQINTIAKQKLMVLSILT